MNILTNCFLMLIFPSNWFSHCKNYFSVIRRNGGNRSCAIIFILHSPLLVERTFVWTIFSVPYPDVVSALLVMIWRNCNIKTELTLITLIILVKSNLSDITITITSIGYCFLLFIIIGTVEWVCDVHLFKITFM